MALWQPSASLTWSSACPMTSPAGVLALPNAQLLSPFPLNRWISTSCYFWIKTTWLKRKWYGDLLKCFHLCWTSFLQFEELWEGEEIVYKCKNETLVINNNPDQKTVKYKCRVSGRYNSPSGDEVTRWTRRNIGNKIFFRSGQCAQKSRSDRRSCVLSDWWPASLIRTLNTGGRSESGIDKNRRNALYGGSSMEEGGTSEMTKRFLAVTLPSLLTMVALIVLLCCCTRPDSIICRICEVFEIQVLSATETLIIR